MVNPDNKTTTTSLETFGISIPLGIIYTIILIFLFMNKDSIPFFNLFLWVIFPIIAFSLSSVVNIINQYISCNKINTGKAFLGAIPSLISILIAMGFGNISYCRIPITSVFAPIFLNQQIDILSNNNINSSDIKETVKKYCCPTKMTLSQVEEMYPQLKGISIGFYVLFGVLFGNVFGTGLSSIC
jgi:hypothetical protein